MAAFYQTFTTARTNEPDPASLLAQLRALDPTAGIQHQPGSLDFIIKKNSAWTPTHVTAAQNVLDTAPASSPLLNFTATSRQKDVLAMCALIVRARSGIAAWNGMTVQQKKDAALAEADVWVNIRDFIETNL